MEKYLESYIKLIYNQIELALQKDEVPIASLAYDLEGIIALHHNQTTTAQNALSHSELLCIDECCKKRKNERLTGVNLLCSLEPCVMCSGAIIQARIDKVFYLCRATSGLSLSDILQSDLLESLDKEKKINHIPEIVFLDEHEARIMEIMKGYFGEKR